MASDPSYDPNGLDDPATLRARSTATTANAPLRQPRDAERLSAGLDDEGRHRRRGARHGALPARLARDGENGKPISGVPLNNFGSEDFGDVDLTFALTNSINTVWAEVGEKLGGRTMQRYMERFGFYAEPPIDYPDAADVGLRRAQARAARAGDERLASTSAASPSARATCSPRRCRWPRSRRRSPTAACA